MALSDKKLGKGLGSLIPTKEEEHFIEKLDIERIITNSLQPRKFFDDEKVLELSVSIKENGVLQPIIVKNRGENYEIIAGERRYRASKLAGLKKVPVIIKDVADEKQLEIAVIENVQRENLTPIEEAEAYQLLKDKYLYSTNQLAERLGKNRATIANMLRILELSDEIKLMVNSKEISYGHARALLSLKDEKRELEVAKKIIKDGLSVRKVESLVKEKLEKRKKRISRDSEMVQLENRLKEYLEAKVKVKDMKNGRGKIEIEYCSNGDFERILEIIGLDGIGD